MQIAILGPLEVRDDAGRQIEVAGARLRTLLTRLALDAGRWVSTGALVDAVWGDVPPGDEVNALQTLVSRLRRVLGGPGAIASSPAGYRLGGGDAASGSVDAARFEAAVRDASVAAGAGRPGDAVDLLDDALALWRGPALAGSADGHGPLAAEAVRLEQLRQTARVERAELRVSTGAPDVAELEALGAELPLNEHLAVLLMRALAASGRQADALQTFETLRARLADELGVDPSADARAAHLELLRGEPAVPAPSAPAQRRSNLRVSLTSFVGRDIEQQTIRDRLAAGERLVTLVGPGGAGKTRLATEAVRGLTDVAPDGVWLAELAAVTAGADVAQAVLAAIGIRELHAEQGPPRDATVRLTSGLSARRLLIVLDNCEHVVDAAAELTETLLGECPGLRVVATSREPLGIGGESLYPVPPLARPSDSADAAEAAEFASVSLFADRAASARPGFVVDATTVGPVVEIVRRLDGLPLAIELAAARLRSVPLDDIAARLSDRFRLLTGGSRTALPRHRTLRAVVEWSWDLLQPGERSLMELLSVFPAGVTVESAVAVRPDDVPAADVPDLLAALVDKSLLQPVGEGRRLRMLETIREYGIERLDERGALDDARQRHAQYFVHLLREAVPHLVTRDQLPWFALLRAELENALAAMRFLASRGDADRSLQAAIDLSLLALLVGGQDDAAGWLTEVLAVPGGDRPLRAIAEAVRAMSSDFASKDETVFDSARLRQLSDELGAIDLSFSPLLAILRPGAAFVLRDMARARQLLDEAMAHEDPWIRAAARLFSVNLFENEGEIADMRREAELAVAEFRALGERWGTSSALRSLGQVRTLEGDLDAAAALYAESMELRAELASQDDSVFLLVELADIALRRGDVAAARDTLVRATEQAEGATSDFESVFAWTMIAQLERRTGTRRRAVELAEVARERLGRVSRTNPMQNYVGAMFYRLLGELALDDGDLDGAGRHARTVYDAAVGTQDLPVIASSGILSAELDEAAGNPAGAARRLGAADRLRGAPDPLSPDIVDVARRVREALGDEAYDAELARGRAMSRDEAIAALDPAHPA